MRWSTVVRTRATWSSRSISPRTRCALELSLDDVALPIDVAPSGDRQIVCGLAVIDSLARRWGGDHTGRGTCLWFELDAGCA